MTISERWILKTARDGHLIADLSAYPSEEQIENLITAHPATIREGVRLVARQAVIPAGKPDLLGVDQDGRLVVFELKAMSSARDVFAQAIDYASWFHSADFSDVANAIERSPEYPYIPRIDDVAAWYRATFSGRRPDALLPVRIVIVAVGADPASARIASFLSQHGIETEVIDLELTRSSSKTKPPESSTSAAPSSRTSRRAKRASPRQSANEQKLLRRAAEHGSVEWLSAAHAAILERLPDASVQVQSRKHAGYIYMMPDVVSGNRVGYIGLYLDPNQQRHILVYPFEKMRDLVDAASLENLRRHLTIYQEKALFTHGAFRFKSLAEWEQYGPDLCHAVEQLLVAWRRKRSESS